MFSYVLYNVQTLIAHNLDKTQCEEGRVLGYGSKYTIQNKLRTSFENALTF